MYWDILLVTDGNRPVLRGLNFVIEIFLDSRYSIVSIATTPNVIAIDAGIKHMAEKTAMKAIEESTEYVAQQGKEKIASSLLHGKAVDVLPNFINEKNTELLVLETVYDRHGKKDIRKFVTDILIDIEIPIFLINEDMAIRRPECILVVTDGTMKSRRAELNALLLAKQFEAKVIGVDMAQAMSMNQEIPKTPKERLQRIMMNCKKLGIPFKEYMIKDVISEIRPREPRIDMVVVAIWKDKYFHRLAQKKLLKELLECFRAPVLCIKR